MASRKELGLKFQAVYGSCNEIFSPFHSNIRTWITWNLIPCQISQEYLISNSMLFIFINLLMKKYFISYASGNKIIMKEALWTFSNICSLGKTKFWNKLIILYFAKHLLSVVRIILFPDLLRAERMREKNNCLRTTKDRNAFPSVSRNLSWAIVKQKPPQYQWKL